MHVFAPEVLGVQVLFHARVNWDRIPALPTTRPGTRTSTPEHNQCPAMLLPQGAELFAIFIDENYGMFVQPQGFADTLHVLHARWGELRRLLPADSSCLVVVYTSKSEKLTMGVYDVLRLSAHDHTQQTVFERQNVLHTLFQNAPRLDVITRHWVGLEYSLLMHMQEPDSVAKLPFEVSHMLRLCSGSAAQYELLLRPICIPQTINPSCAVQNQRLQK